MEECTGYIANIKWENLKTKELCSKGGLTLSFSDRVVKWFLYFGFKIFGVTPCMELADTKRHV